MQHHLWRSFLLYRNNVGLYAKGWCTYDVHESSRIFNTTTPCPSTSEILLHPRSWTSNLKQTSPLQMITNQLKENMIQGWLFGYYILSTKFIIIKGWLHCLTSESKRRFLVSNILFGSAWCLVIAQIQFSLIKKIGRSEHLLHPPQPFYVRQGSIFISPQPQPHPHTHPTPTPPPLPPHQTGCHMCIVPNLFPCRLGYISQK